MSVQALAAALHENKTLKLLNIESNYVSGQAIVNILAAINVHQVVTEFKVSNQVHSVHCSAFILNLNNFRMVLTCAHLIR